MCGLCGVVALDRPPEVELARAMADELRHRGPDGDGVWTSDAGVALGHRRLAIIDLSDAGLQPFASDDGRVQLLHNGEIYNYRELRRELEAKGRRFRSRTDTEVVVEAYREWGEDCVTRFNGMWAIALWDEDRRTLFCSRDRFGVKPFYYRLADDRFVFASEPKAFRADRSTRLEPNPALVRAYLELSHLDHTDETFFAGIRRLPPAHSLSFGPEGLRIRRYWRLEQRDPPADAVAAVRELLLDSVRLRLRSDVPVGTCLSGGIDSSAIAVLVSHLLETTPDEAESVGRRLKTFTAYFDDPRFDERPFAQAVVDRTRSEPYWVTFDDRELVERLPDIVESQDEPFGSTSMCAQWFVMRTAREAGVKVVLDGQGSDETFAGYRASHAARFADLLAAGELAELGSEVGAWRRLRGASRVDAAVMLARTFAPEAVERHAYMRFRGTATLAHPELPAGADLFANGGVFRDRLRRNLHLLLTRRGLPELLRYEDRNSMAHSLESRVPFLDYRLVETVFSLRGGELIRGGLTKSVLRRALSDLLPPAVRDRVDKLGFVTPERAWLGGALGDLAAETFASRRFAERGFVNAAEARAQLERHRRGEIDAGFELWRALNVELWAQAFVDP